MGNQLTIVQQSSWLHFNSLGSVWPTDSEETETYFLLQHPNKLPNGGTWPINGSLNNNTILQLDLFSPNTRVNGQRYLMLRSSFYSKKIIPLQKCKLATVAFYLILARQPLLSLLWLNSLNSQLLLLLLLATVPSIYPKLPQYPGRSPPPSKSSSISLEKVCLLVET